MTDSNLAIVFAGYVLPLNDIARANQSNYIVSNMITHHEKIFKKVI